MDGHDKTVKRLQAEAMAELQKILEKADSDTDPFRAERALLLMDLVRARLRKKLTQAELAAEAGMQQSTVSRIENGRGNPSLRTLLAIAGALDVSLVIEYKH